MEKTPSVTIKRIRDAWERGPDTDVTISGDHALSPISAHGDPDTGGTMGKWNTGCEDSRDASITLYDRSASKSVRFHTPRSLPV